MIERVLDYFDFRNSSPFRLRAGGLYKVTWVRGLASRRHGTLKLFLESGEALRPEGNDIIMCVSAPKKYTHGDVDNGFVQYWGADFLYNEKVGRYSIVRSPMDLREFEYELNLRVLQVK